MMPLLAIAGALAAFVFGWFLSSRVDQPSRVPDPGVVVSAPVEPADPGDRELLERLPLGVVVSEPGRGITFRNAVARELTGTHVGVLIDEAIDRHIAAVLGGEPASETLELFGPPRRVVTVSAQAFASGHVVVVVDDISDRRRTDWVRTDFVANVSHELRTPIGALIALADTLIGENDPDLIRRVVDRMLSEAERASRTLDALLELSQIEAGIQTEFEPVRVSDLIGDAIERVAETAARRRIVISTTGPEADALSVDGDRRQLSSAIGNIIENAVKYSDDGASVRADISADGQWAEVTVTDDGPGISRQDLDRIFERFYRVDPARSRTTGGTGLGLSIVRNVARSHGGSVRVDSVEGEGSTFTVRLPLSNHPSPQANEGVA
jgi:two-component system sensor histidine kinase SenX3